MTYNALKAIRIFLAHQIIKIIYVSPPQRRLTQKYSIAVGVPTLVIRGRHVRDALLDDALGERFPWPPPPLTEVLRGVQLQGDGDSRLYEQLPADAVRVFYFAAHWVSWFEIIT